MHAQCIYIPQFMVEERHHAAEDAQEVEFVQRAAQKHDGEERRKQHLCAPHHLPVQSSLGFTPRFGVQTFKCLGFSLQLI